VRERSGGELAELRNGNLSVCAECQSQTSCASETPSTAQGGVQEEVKSGIDGQFVHGVAFVTPRRKLFM
jgi:positive regulator of sigma E activity